MLLAVDIGNTNIVLGCIREEQILFDARMSTDRFCTADQYAVRIRRIVSSYGVQPGDIDGCIVSSVVPPVLGAVRDGIVCAYGVEPMVVGTGLKTGLDIRADSPAHVGSDRIVAAVAALELYAPPLLLVDMGTAITMDVVEPPRVYAGGVIMPGVRTALDALTGKTAQLPGISLSAPQTVVGKNTVDCMRSGVMHGTAAMIDGMIDRICDESGKAYTLVATGGLAPLILPLCRHEILLQEDLLLLGLKAIYARNKG